MKRIIKIIALVITMLVLFTSCRTDTSWVADWGEERLPAGSYILFLEDSYNRGLQMLVDEYLEWEEAGIDLDERPSIFDMDVEDILELELEGIRFYDWVHIEARNSIYRYFAVRALLDEYDIEADLFEMGMAIMGANDEYRAHEESFRSMGIGEHSLVLNRMSAVNHVALFLGLYDRGGVYAIPQDEIRAYFEENFVAGNELIFFKEMPHLLGEETEEEIAQEMQRVQEVNIELRELAEEFLERLQGGESIEQLQYERDLMYTSEPELINVQAPGVLDFITRVEEHNIHHNEIVVEGLQSLSVGESGIFEDEWLIVVVRRLDVLANQRAMNEQMEELVWSMRFEDSFLPLLDEVGRTLPITINEAAINRYTLSRLID